ncbi:MAG: hypothetical protein M5U28_02560 [Sandaracinaceae bacterium]|nr:hypothetical protein [Sandaracinaceae bacterium]
MHASEERYPVLRSKVDAASEAFGKNREQNLATLARLEQALAKSRQGEGRSTSRATSRPASSCRASASRC